MPPPYINCGFFGFGKKEVGDDFLSSVCGDGTAFRDGKCVSIVDIVSDNASVCGDGTAFRDGKCHIKFGANLDMKIFGEGHTHGQSLNDPSLMQKQFGGIPRYVECSLARPQKGIQQKGIQPQQGIPFGPSASLNAKIPFGPSASLNANI